MKKLTLLVNQNQTTLSSHKVDLEQSLQRLGGEVAEVKNEIEEIKETVTAIKTIIHQLYDSKGQ